MRAQIATAVEAQNAKPTLAALPFRFQRASCRRARAGERAQITFDSAQIQIHALAGAVMTSAQTLAAAAAASAATAAVLKTEQRTASFVWRQFLELPRAESIVLKAERRALQLKRSCATRKRSAASQRIRSPRAPSTASIATIAHSGKPSGRRATSDANKAFFVSVQFNLAAMGSRRRLQIDYSAGRVLVANSRPAFGWFGFFLARTHSLPTFALISFFSTRGLTNFRLTGGLFAHVSRQTVRYEQAEQLITRREASGDL